MSKPRKYGSQRPYVPNAKADMRYRKKGYQRGQRAEGKSRERREERGKVDACRSD